MDATAACIMPSNLAADEETDVSERKHHTPVWDINAPVQQFSSKEIPSAAAPSHVSGWIAVLDTGRSSGTKLSRACVLLHTRCAERRPWSRPGSIARCIRSRPLASQASRPSDRAARDAITKRLQPAA